MFFINLKEMTRKSFVRESDCTVVLYICLCVFCDLLNGLTHKSSVLDLDCTACAPSIIHSEITTLVTP